MKSDAADGDGVSALVAALGSVLSGLSVEHVALLRALLELLDMVEAASHSNEMGFANLAPVFGPTIIVQYVVRSVMCRNKKP